MGFVKRKACSKTKIDFEHFNELKEEFLLDIKNIVTMDEIPMELIIANCTDRLQPLDLSIKKAAKGFIHSKFQDWYAQ